MNWLKVLKCNRKIIVTPNSKAYKKLMSDIGETEGIKNELGLNTDQLFFVQFAQVIYLFHIIYVL